MNKVKINKTSNPDNGYVSKIELYDDTQQHRGDVYKVLLELSYVLREIGYNHDWSKIVYFDDFSKDTLERLNTPDFKSRRWYHIHTVEERHHINARVPDNVNLFDILEMIVDCIVAGKARTSKVDYNFLKLKNNILEDAYWNTIKLIDEYVELKNTGD